MLSGTSRWGEYGDGGLLWGECSSKYFEWFEGDPVHELLGKVYSIVKYPTSPIPVGTGHETLPAKSCQK